MSILLIYLLNYQKQVKEKITTKFNFKVGYFIPIIMSQVNSDKYIITNEYRGPNKPELIQYTASVRYNKEVSGITVSNNFIFTDRQSQAMINGIVTLVQLQPNTVINFKTGSGFIEANSQIIASIATSVATHIQNCFNLESEAIQQIEANTFTQFSQIDDFFR